MSRKKFNPSSWKQRITLSCLAGIAVLIAAYMGLYQWGLITEVWDPLFGQETVKVLSSSVSSDLLHVLQMPDAVLGAIAYLGDIIFGLAGSAHRWKDRPWLVLLFGLYVIPPSVVGFILVCLQGAVVGSWCFLCMTTAAISVALVFLSYKEVWICLSYLHAVWKRGRSGKLLWKTLWGNASKTAVEAAEQIEARHVGKSG